MENRERDRVSQRTEPTEAGKLNRETSETLGRRSNVNTTAEFGQSIGRSEDLREGGEMRNRNNDDMSNRNSNDEPSRRSGSEGYGSSTGRSGPVGGSDVSHDQGTSRSRKDLERNRNIGDSSEDRH